MPKKLVYGVGINDANYQISITDYSEGKAKIIWKCPYYMRWAGMLARCYSGRCPSYKGCSVWGLWFYFSNFKAWMEQQDWEGKELDKDLLVVGNKLYSPKNCIFVSAKVNSFITEATANRGQYPLGVIKARGKFQAACGTAGGRVKIVGYFDNPQDASNAWLTEKLKQAYILAEQQTDERVAKALIDRYENYKLESL